MGTRANDFFLILKSFDFITFEWKSVLLEAQPDLGKFSFSCSLYRSGHIIFYYKDIPITKPFGKSLATIFDSEKWILNSTFDDDQFKKEEKIHGLGAGVYIL